MSLIYIQKFTPFLLHREKILWVGQSRQGLRLNKTDFILLPMNIFWGGGFIVANVLVWFSPKAEPLLWLQLLPGSIIGAYVIFGRFLLDAYIRKNLFYALTDKRVLIFHDYLRHRLIACKLSDIAGIRLNSKKNDHGNIVFQRRYDLMVDRPRAWTPTLAKVVQFYDIKDADRLSKLARSALKASGGTLFDLPAF